MLQTAIILALTAVLMPTIHGVGAEEPCPGACTKEHNPQCVSVTKEFGNRCVMEAAQCMLNKAGFTLSGVHDCSTPAKRRDAGFIQRAAAKRDDDSECPPSACTMQHDPVCATYTATFSNPCVMNTAICRLENAMSTQLDVTSQTNGACPSIQK